MTAQGGRQSVPREEGKWRNQVLLHFQGFVSFLAFSDPSYSFWAFQEPLKSVPPPTDIQQEQVKQPTPLPVPCLEVPSELPGETPLEHGEKHTTLVKEEAEDPEQQLEQEKAQRQQPLKGELEQENNLLDQQLDQERAKKDEQLERKEEQLLEHLEQREKQQDPAAQQEGQLKQPVFTPAPGQDQETHPAQPLKGDVLLPEEQQQQQQV
ncbi:hypothetical protein CB1_000306035 [Camelus ferus]|nr:hypothetical protein CB1_000306035 [Camelus ferus]